MKKIELLIAILPLITIGCSEENTDNDNTSTKRIEHQNNSITLLGFESANAVNPFDGAGKVYNQILEELVNSKSDSRSIEEIAIFTNSLSAELPNQSFSLASRSEEIKDILDNKLSIEQTVLNSALGKYAQRSLLTFINVLDLETKLSYGDLYVKIASYESYILANSRFSTNEKEVVLIAVSVIRYSASSKERKDKDWETSVTKSAASASTTDLALILRQKIALLLLAFEQYIEKSK